jgi:predicted dehydrogenase
VPFTLCIIGCGSLSRSAHGPSYRKYADEDPDFILAGCCDMDAERAEKYRSMFGFARAYTDFHDMLEAEQPDAVCLMAPVELTSELSCEILSLGYPLFMEKPPGLNGEECRRMIVAAEEAGVPTQVAFNRRYCPLVAELKKELGRFNVGDIQDIRYDFFRIGRKDPDFSTTAIHGIDTVKFLAGSDYRRVRFSYREFPELGPNVANIFMDCEFASGATAHLNFCPNAGVLIERATVNLLDHTFMLNVPIWAAYDTPGRLVHLHRGETVSDVLGDSICEADKNFIAGGFYAENASFFDDLRADRRPVGDVASGLQSVEIAECIRLRRQEYVRE